MKKLLASLVVMTVLAFAGAAGAQDAFYEIKCDKPSFTPSEITVNKGQKVTLKFTSQDVAHGINLSVFGLKNILIPEKESVTVEFVPDKPGKYSLPCSKYCGWRHLVGKRPRLTVTVVDPAKPDEPLKTVTEPEKDIEPAKDEKPAKTE